MCRLLGESSQSFASAVNLYAVNELKCDPCGCLKTANKPDRKERRRGGKRENLATVVSGETCHKLRKWRKFCSSVWFARQFLLFSVKKFGNRSVWAMLSLSFSLAGPDKSKTLCNNSPGQRQAPKWALELNPKKSCNQLARPMQWPPVAYVMANICCLILWKCAANATTLAQVAAPA